MAREAPEWEVRRMHIRRILNNKGGSVITVEPTATLAHASALLAEHGIGALVVSRDQRTIEGLVSERELARALAEHGAATVEVTVDELMMSPVRTCSPEATIDELMGVMTEHRIRHLPVVDDDGAMVGLISIGDVVKHRVGELEEESKTLHEYLVTGRS